MTAAVPLGIDPGPGRATSTLGGLRWVHDPDDDQACLHHLAALHAPGAGRVVCHPTPGATGPILARDLLEALGKRRDALTRARRARDGAALVRVWMRAERVEHLVVLRAHRLHPQLLDAFAELSAATGPTVWLVWHHTDPPPAQAWSWPRAVDAIRGHPHADRSVRLRPVEVMYGEAVAEARREARLWRVAPPRQRRYTQPGCGLGALLQRLTIDATTEAELCLHLDAAQVGFAAEGLTLVLPPEPAALAALGPRVTPRVVARLRRIGCPASAAALLLALATDARAGQVASCSPRSISPDLGQVRLLPGTYRIPERARPLLRAALLDHQARGLPAYALFAGARGGGLLLPQAMGNLIGRAAALADLPVPLAATSAGRGDSGSEEPFATALVTSGAGRIDGGGPPPQLRPRWPRLRPPRSPVRGRALR